MIKIHFLLCYLILLGLIFTQPIDLKTETFQAEVLDKKDQAVFVLFHATWCGHCKNLMPDYETVSERLKGLVVFARVESEERELLSRYEIKSFPTLIMFAPASENDPSGEKKVIPFQRQRTRADLTEFAIAFIPNYVEYVEDKSWFETDSKKVLLFPSKKFNTIPPLFKGIARDFRNDLKFGIVFSRYSIADELYEEFKIDTFPKLMIIEENSQQIVQVYDQNLNLKSITSFLQNFLLDAETEAESNENSIKKENIKKEL
ncbi:protein disulfide-isomerase a6 [Anaeramoeba flamelloides]|uniref:Protein disulfide-isomerase a6 n=1 Tax=Anaeramoeba flamelloides TaxID=1746091 RepID=A0AAV8A4W7_9EUKA|nr:protein disulfide-isomerase a6 [Anaeramoeba flamelloides]KAJ6236469.1 protein disulfide-isomerase a6 [Anaeramoeba flamelloides]